MFGKDIYGCSGRTDVVLFHLWILGSRRAMFGEQSAPVVTLGAICGFLRVTKCVCFSLQHPQTARPSSPSGGKERRECLIRLFHSERMTFLFYGLNKSQGKQFSLVVLYLRELNYCDIQTKIVCHLYTKNLRTPQLQTIIELYVNL